MKFFVMSMHIRVTWLNVVLKIILDIINGDSKNAWEIYLNMETSNDSFNLLILIANETFKVFKFYFRSKNIIIQPKHLIFLNVLTPVLNSGTVNELHV